VPAASGGDAPPAIARLASATGLLRGSRGCGRRAAEMLGSATYMGPLLGFFGERRGCNPGAFRFSEDKS